ncbi:diacylglycerol/lipid kinase family protein [Actinomadura alba]|uniref:YegS/Rv2252/BmrU family lipid kinase n=1 Tax=Actinomadura alba TaxID=406431 RepID=A0ABR7LTM3_9ACTN|nr:YegS/Rv2252/BmrU family lipid kinase [Actinomadura alba]MBC6468196.1 YegS/Rv2252/BmrU family lipid kinase [Actinomadura alba]
MRSKPQLEAAIRHGGRAVLIVNTRSRSGRRHFDEARRLLGEAGLRFADVFPIADPSRMPEIFREALDSDPDLVIVGGGDGTVKEAVSHVAERDVALGLLPLGTTNNFARSLRLPLNLARAVAVLRDGKVADVDVGRVRYGADPADSPGDVFANMISLGLSVEVAGQVPHGLKRVVGRAAYALTALRLMPGHRPFDATVRVGDTTRRLTTHQLNVANGSHHAGRPIAADASADDRLLAVYRLGNGARLRLAAETARHALIGHRRTLAQTALLTTDDVYLETDPPLPVDVDGEVRGRTPVRVSLVPNALRVMVAQSFLDT